MQVNGYKTILARERKVTTLLHSGQDTITHWSAGTDATDAADLPLPANPTAVGLINPVTGLIVVDRVEMINPRGVLSLVMTLPAGPAAAINEIGVWSTIVSNPPAPGLEGSQYLNAVVRFNSVWRDPNTAATFRFIIGGD